MTLLQLSGLSRQFGGLNALTDINLSVEPGEVIGLIGPNGAGKTTLINVITGVHPASSGSVVFAGKDITRYKPYQAARSGVARTFQIVQPFPEMNVLDNVAAGAIAAGGATSVKDARAQAMQQLEFAGLTALANNPASSLTLAMRKRLELAKSLAMNPRLLLLDEVNAGLNATEIDQALKLVREISARGVTILLVEHLMKVVLSLCTRIVVLHHGKLIAQGTPDQVIRDPVVVQAYLGRRYADAERTNV
jgi:branched-chain amino acid transport system ATP-binding protein